MTNKQTNNKKKGFLKWRIQWHTSIYIEFLCFNITLTAVLRLYNDWNVFHTVLIHYIHQSIVSGLENPSSLFASGIFSNHLIRYAVSFLSIFLLKQSSLIFSITCWASLKALMCALKAKQYTLCSIFCLQKEMSNLLIHTYSHAHVKTEMDERAHAHLLNYKAL